ncbi:VCBS repeat-containing protein [Candidatus Pacearchaeota archaeon]|nr:VCBS repeat-containing protein [Candidatus Pacearchaeota archaeon]
MKKRRLLVIAIVVSLVLINLISASDVGLIEDSTWESNLSYTLHSVTALGDVDNDGDLDLAWAGCSSGNVQTCTAYEKPKIYLNNGTSLIENQNWQQNLSGNLWPSIAFGDVNNDGYLDLVIGGSDSSQTTKIYLNNGTSLTENIDWQRDLNPSNEEANGPIALGDLDLDGDLDLVVVKFSGTSRVVYINNGTSFVGNSSWDSNITAASRVSTALVDMDNDNDLDLSVIGLFSTKVYMNNGTSFIFNSTENIVAMDHASTAWGDIDNDNDLDLFLMGEKGACVTTGRWFYENNGTQSEEIFVQNTDWEGSIIGLFYGFSVFGDYDNDGYLDLVINGQCGGTPYTKIYRNDGTSLIENSTAQVNITSKQAGSLVWGDLDNDFDLDLIEIGVAQLGGQEAKIYINNITTPNNAPTPPASFSYAYNNREIALGWLNGSDNETISTGLYYNLKLGTIANNHSIISGIYGGLSSSNDAGGTAFGYFGNMMQRKNFTLKVDRLSPSTTYYWSVQSIDTGLEAGNWSAAQSFTTLADLNRPIVTLNSPVVGGNLSSYNVVFNVTVADNLNLSNVSLWGNWGNGWSQKQINSSGINNTDYIFSEYVPVQGTSQWYIVACDNATNCQTSETRSFSIGISVGLIESPQWQGNLTGSNSHNGAIFGDIDNDGDLDMVSIGCDSGIGVCNVADKSYVWINNGTSFVENATWEQNLLNIRRASLAFGDIDNDGDLDLVLSSISNSTLYTNNGTSFVENSTWQETIVPEEAGSYSVAFGDMDNDGDLDLVFPGKSGSNGLNITYLYNGTTFIGNIPLSQEITSEGKSSPGLVDLDNDGDLDLNIIGEDSSKSYINNGTSLIENSNWSTTRRDEANVAWGDIDNDGDFDYCVSGGSFNVGINNESVESMWTYVSSWNLDLSNLIWGSMMLGDYSNNGYLDLVNLGGDEIHIIGNNGSAFARDTTAESNLTGERDGSAIWGDIDNDGDLDLVVIKSQKVYINNITTPNVAPTPPASFSYAYNNREIALGWLNGSDNETISTGLYYNLKLGTSANNHSIISGIYGGAGDASRGGTAFGYFGNMMQRKNFTLKVDRLSPSTTYYWSVQTIDTGLEAGNWSAAQSFTTLADLDRPVVTLNSPVAGANLSSYNIMFNVTVADNLNLSSVSLWGNWGGGWHLNETNSSGANDTNYIFTINLSGEGDGTYLWKIQAGDNVTNVENSSVRAFTIDTTAPSVGSENKSLTTVYTNTSVTLNATVSDTGVGLDDVWISVNSSGSFVNYSSLSSSGDVYSFVLNSGNYSKDVNVSWRYYANDSAGNLQIGGLQSFVVANSLPVLSGIPDNSTNEDVAPADKFYNLSLYGSDTDLDNLTFYVQSQSNSSLINCIVYNVSVAYYLNCSTPLANASGSSTIIVNVTDGSAWANDSFIVSVNAVNDVPWVSGVNLTALGLNKTNETLTGVYVFNDVESSVETLNETKWYRNDTEVVGLANLSSVTSGYTTKGENWTFSVRVNDGTDWSNWYNSSILIILNSVPEFSVISNKSWVMNSNLTLNLSQYFTDIDSDSLTYTNTTVLNISVDINQTTSIVTLVPDVGWNGTRYITFNGTNVISVASNNITLNVFRPVINYSEFDGITTNFTNLTDFVNIPIVIEQTSSGKMSFDSVTLNSTFVNISEHVNISFNRISLNSSVLPELNEPATLSLYNLTYTNPRVLKDGAVCSDCVEVSYGSGNFVFNVTSFSVYSAGETPVDVNNDPGGSSGGGGGVVAMTYTASKEEIKSGYAAQLAKGDRVSFSSKGENHSLEVKSIIDSIVNITLTSDPINFLISVGQEKKFDLNNNSFYDLLVKLNSIAGVKANLTLTEINEAIEVVSAGEGDGVDSAESGEGQDEGDRIGEEGGFASGGMNTWFYWLIGVIVVVIVIIAGIVWFFGFRKTGGKK